MPEYLSPGVYVEEISTGPRPIEGVSTSTAGMLGPSERGPLSPQLVTSWLEFQRWYGGYLPLNESYLPYAVQGFFDNGGQRLFVGRIIAQDATFAQQTIGDLHIHALGPGACGNRIFIRISDASQRNATNNYFRLTILYFSQERMPPDPANVVDPLNPNNASNPDLRLPNRIEDFDNLVHTPGAPNFVEIMVNSGSQLVRVWMTVTPPGPVPVNPNYAQLAADAQDGAAVDAPDYDGNMEVIVPGPRSGDLLGQGRGLAALEAIDEISLLVVPDEVRFGAVNAMSPVTNAVINQCERLTDRFAVVSVVQGATTAANVRPPRDTTYAAFYYPWIEIYDPVTRGPVRIPPTGHVTGLIARTDIERGVHKAPANEVVRNATNLEFVVTKGMQDILNPRGVNCIRDFRTDRRGIRLWGARTMSSDAMWKYVNVRRLFIFIEESINEGTQWVVFEPNDYSLWASVRQTIVAFLTRVWKSGALLGLTQEEAFFVKCDRTTMTQDDIDNGRLICYIGIAPVKPAEFVIFKISQKTAEAPS
jgi:uncharacterized protein